jgi:RES domain-containing protein
VRVWRICREPYAADAIVGRGGLFTSGRWHTRGRPVIYTSQSLALAALEVLVHVDRTTMPADLVQIEIDVPDDLDILRIEIKALPKGWKTSPAPPELQRRGDAWLSAGSTPVLQVPSAVIPEELNFLLNPQHADARRLRVVSTRKFEYDARLRP